MHDHNESTAGADASVEMPKLHNIATNSFYTHDEHFCNNYNFAACKNSKSG